MSRGCLDTASFRDTPLIAYNGALVWDVAESEPLLHLPILPEAARALVAFLRERDPGLNLSLECGNRWYIGSPPVQRQHRRAR